MRLFTLDPPAATFRTFTTRYRLDGELVRQDDDIASMKIFCSLFQAQAKKYQDIESNITS